MTENYEFASHFTWTYYSFILSSFCFRILNLSSVYKCSPPSHIDFEVSRCKFYLSEPMDHIYFSTFYKCPLPLMIIIRLLPSVAFAKNYCSNRSEKISQSSPCVNRLIVQTELLSTLTSSAIVIQLHKFITKYCLTDNC